MSKAIPAIIDKNRQALAFQDRDKVPDEFLGKIQTVYVCNDENAPFAVHPHGPVAFSRGGTVNVANNKGGFTNFRQTLVNAGVTGAASGSTVYTVTTGKTFYCTGFTVGTGSTASTMILKSDGVIVARCIRPTTDSMYVGGGGAVIFSTASTKLVTVEGDNASNTVQIWGFEEDA